MIMKEDGDGAYGSEDYEDDDDISKNNGDDEK